MSTSEFSEYAGDSIAEGSRPFFSVSVGNPPYQISANIIQDRDDGWDRGYPVWQYHLGVGHAISGITAIINPARWQKGSAGTGLIPTREWLSSSPYLSRFVNLDGQYVFPETTFKGGVCIEVMDQNKPVNVSAGVHAYKHPLFQKFTAEDGLSNSVEYNFDNGLDIFVDDPHSLEIVNKVINANKETDTLSTKGLYAGTIEQFVIDNKVILYLKKPHPVSGNYDMGTNYAREDRNLFKLEPFDNSYTVLTLAKNKQPILRYIAKDETRDDKFEDKAKLYKVLLPKTHIHSMYRNIGRGVLGPDWVASTSWNAIGFDNPDRAANFYTYLETYFFRFMGCMRRTTQHANVNIYRWVPDLSTTVNPRTELTGYDSDWYDDDLVELFADVLTDDDWRHMKQVVLEHDGGRGDYEAGFEVPVPFNWESVLEHRKYPITRKSLTLVEK